MRLRARQIAARGLCDDFIAHRRAAAHLYLPLSFDFLSLHNMDDTAATAAREAIARSFSSPVPTRNPPPTPRGVGGLTRGAAATRIPPSLQAKMAAVCLFILRKSLTLIFLSSAPADDQSRV